MRSLLCRKACGCKTNGMIQFLRQGRKWTRWYLFNIFSIFHWIKANKFWSPYFMLGVQRTWRRRRGHPGTSVENVNVEVGLLDKNFNWTGKHGIETGYRAGSQEAWGAGRVYQVTHPRLIGLVSLRFSSALHALISHTISRWGSFTVRLINISRNSAYPHVQCHME